jgi:hypothetical protein
LKFALYDADVLDVVLLHVLLMVILSELQLTSLKSSRPTEQLRALAPHAQSPHERMSLIMAATSDLWSKPLLLPWPNGQGTSPMCSMHVS